MILNNEGKAVVLVSGGQDSVTVLAHAARLHGAENIYPLNLFYGQQHAVEMEQAKKCCKAILGKEDLPQFSLEFLADLADSALLSSTDTSVEEPHHHDNDLPASFVPNRNAALLTVAHGYAMKIGAEYVYAGMCQTDYSGYPDCRDEFVRLLEHALNIGAPKEVTFLTPLMFIDKGETFRLAEEEGVLDLVLEDSHTCYNGVRNKEGERHAWGHGCGKCPACLVRKAGFESFQRRVKREADEVAARVDEAANLAKDKVKNS